MQENQQNQKPEDVLPSENTQEQVDLVQTPEEIIAALEMQLEEKKILLENFRLEIKIY